MMPAEDTRRLIAELETALRLDRPASVRVARAVAAAEDAERRSGGGGFAPRPAAKADAAARPIFWRLVADEVRQGEHDTRCGTIGHGARADEVGELLGIGAPRIARDETAISMRHDDHGIAIRRQVYPDLVGIFGAGQHRHAEAVGERLLVFRGRDARTGHGETAQFDGGRSRWNHGRFRRLGDAQGEEGQDGNDRDA